MKETGSIHNKNFIFSEYTRQNISTKSRNPVNSDKIKNIVRFLHDFWIFNQNCQNLIAGWKNGHYAISTLIWDFSNIYKLPKILGLKWFAKSWGNSYTKYVILGESWQIDVLLKHRKIL